MRWLNLSFIMALLGVSLLAQSPDSLIAEGRAAFVGEEYALAKQRFQAAVTADPDREDGWFFLAATESALAPTDRGIASFLGRLGIETEGRSPFYWTAGLITDADGIAITPDDFGGEEIQSFMTTSLLSRLTTIESLLRNIDSSSFLVTLTTAETRTVDVEVDLADVLALRAGLKSLMFFIRTVEAMDLEITVGRWREFLGQGDIINVAVDAFPNLLNFTDDAPLMLARADFEAFVV